MRRPLAIIPVLGAIALIAVAIDGGSDGAYRVQLELENAGGLGEGSPVRVGGVPAGEVVSLRLDRDDTAIAELELERSAAPVGEGAAAAVRSVNLLGQKFVALDRGDTARPLASGAVIPRDRTSVSVDLDQFFNVFDADTRTRLAILINEAGLALTGRRADFNALLERLPPSLDATTRMVSELAADNRGLGRLVERGDRLVARVAAERRELGELVEAAGGAMQTVSSKRERLGETLGRAPAALASLREFLAELRLTTEPLGPAARAVTASAPPLTSTLVALEPFERAARPTLEAGRELAPRLSRLGEEATPVIRRANPTVRALARFSAAMRPLSDALEVSVDDLFGALEAWARATQERDGLGHYFRATVVVSDDLFELVSLLAGDGAPGASSRRPRHERASRRDPADDRGAEPGDTLGRLREAVPDDALDRLLDAAPDVRVDPRPDAVKPPQELTPLLDYLLAP